jgi:hypothetical protein
MDCCMLTNHLQALLNILETRPKGGRLLVLLINYMKKY